MPTQPTAPQATPTPNVGGFITAARAKGVPDTQIYSYLQSKGVIKPAQQTAKSTGSQLPNASNYGSDVANAAEGGANQIEQGIQEAKPDGTGNVGNLVEGVGKVLGGAAQAVTSPIAPILKPVGDAINKAGDALADTPYMQAYGKDTASLPADQPTAPERVAGTIANYANAAGIVGGSEGVVRNLPETIAKAKSGVDSVKTAVQGTPESQAAAKATAAATKQAALTKQAVQDATPAYNKKLIGDGPSTVKVTNPDGTTKMVPRIQEGRGLTKGRTVTSSESEIAAGNELAKVPGYSTAKTALDKFNTVEPEITRQAKALETSLKNEGVLRPPKEITKLIKTAVDGASQDSLLLQKTDPIVQNYMRVAQRAISQSDGTLAGELKVRQALDHAYNDAGGKYTNNKGLDQIHRAARNALNDDLEAKATETSVKGSLRAQSNLFKAGDVLQDKARAEGGSKLEQYMKAHPMATKVGTAAIQGIGLGSALHLLP